MTKNLLSINASETGITSKRSSHKYQKTNCLTWKSKEFENKLFLINTNVSIYHHQLLYVHPVHFYFLSSRVTQMTPYFMILLVLIVNQNFKSWNRHSILLLFSFVFLPFCFLSFFSYYCLRYCCPIIIIVIYLLLVLLFTHLFTYLFIHIYHIV